MLNPGTMSDWLRTFLFVLGGIILPLAILVIVLTV